MIRLGLAVTRGLLLDLVGTDEEDMVDEAYGRFIAMMTQDSRRNGPESSSTHTPADL